MSNAIVQWSPEQVSLISSTIAPGCSSDELKLFAYACQRTGLDPFSKQIYAIKRGGKLTIQAGIDGLRSIAERTGELDGSETLWCGEDGEWRDVWLAKEPPAAAKTVIYRRNCSRPFVGVARFSDYDAGQNLWRKMPATMIGKCSEALALRKAFPANLSGLYSSEEMDQAVDVVQVVDPAPQPESTGNPKVFAAGKAALAKVQSTEELAGVTTRMQARFDNGDLSQDQLNELLKIALDKEAELVAFDD